MSDSQGWVKLHRKTLENPLFKNHKALTLWVYLLLRANYSEQKVNIGNKIIPVPRGSFVTGRKTLSDAVGLPETTLERLLELLESEQQIGQQKYSKYRLISITNYELYQDDGQEVDNKRTTNGQQTDTDKKVKKEKNNIIVPEGINMEAWEEWIAYRKEKKKPVSQVAANKQFKILTKYSDETQQQIIDNSIQNDYQGLFEPKVKHENSKPNNKDNSAAGRVRENARREMERIAAESSGCEAVDADVIDVRS